MAATLQPNSKELMLFTGYVAAVLIGISLGLIGGGGSILTVPVLVYLFGIDAALATTYSLFIVGSTSVAGSISYFKNGLVSLRTVVLFGLPSVVAVLLTRTFIVPAIPQKVFSAGSFVLTKNVLLLVLFAILMVAASFSMLRKQKEPAAKAPSKDIPMALVILQGVGVGSVTGLIGAGGGFLIIPALANMLRLPMKNAVGTSLLIIAINSLTGFFLSPKGGPMDWTLLLSMVTLAITGILLGSFLSGKIDGKKLKPAFGWFVLIMGIYILIKEILL